jgi:hypothetical protein
MTIPKDIREKQFTEILFNISEFGMSWRKALKGVMSSKDFNEMIDSDEEKQKRYVRACEQRADFLAEEAIDISDCIGDDTITTEDGRTIENQRVINRDRLRVDTRKWLLAKLHPKKYGEKISQELTGKDGAALIPIKGITFTDK